MLTFYDPKSFDRNVPVELHHGEAVASMETPLRVTRVLERIRDVGLGPAQHAVDRGVEPICRVHDREYLTFLEHAWDRWVCEAGNQVPPLPSVWPARGGVRCVAPSSVRGAMGHFSFATDTALDAGSWRAAVGSANCAVSAVAYTLQTRQAAFGLCRPPGHHATANQYGGYCFLNNAAIAAVYARSLGVSRVAILDVDYHHGNGTQQIFYGRSDVTYVSLHCDPSVEFPYYSGYESEAGECDGVGFNYNHPMPPGTGYGRWKRELERGLYEISQCGAGLLIISLGVDTYFKDPMGTFILHSHDFVDMGRTIGGIELPTVFLLEGGYAIEDIGVNVTNVLGGFDAR